MLRKLIYIIFLISLSVKGFSQCAVVEVDTVSPQPVSFTYLSGKTVNVCYTLQGYMQNGSNWLDGFEIKLGPGWDVSTLTPTQVPGSCGGQGEWHFQTSSHSTGTGLNFGPGFYFDMYADTDLVGGNDFGDWTPTGTCWWTLCFTVQVKAICSNLDLSISITAIGDGTCGNWNNIPPKCPGIAYDVIPPGTKCLKNCDLIATASSTMTSCAVNDAKTTVAFTGGTGPFAYKWSTGPTTSSLTGLGVGVYTVTMTDGNGCTATSQDTVVMDNKVKITGTSTDVSCFGYCDGTATITATGGITPYFYNWSPTQPPVGSLTGLCAGTYYITVSDKNSCKRYDTLLVNQILNLTVKDTVTPVTCFGGNDGAVAPLAQNGWYPYTYYWSNGKTDSAISNLASGIYYLTVTDAHGCSLNIVTNVTQPVAIAINGQITNATCNGFSDGSVIISPSKGVAPYKLSWDYGGQTGDTLTGVPVGLYGVTVTDNNGCTTQGSYFVKEPPVLGGTFVSNPASCPEVTDGSLEVKVFGGTKPYGYLWNTVPPQTNSVATNLGPGTYTVYIDDSVGCKIILTDKVDALPLFTVDAGSDKEIKKDDEVGLSLFFDKSGNYLITWLPDTGLNNPFVLNPVASPSVTTTYTVEVVNADNGCKTTDTVVVTVLPSDFLYVPNAFSPNGDGINDFFFPLAGDIVHVVEFKIYERWGQLVYSGVEHGWDGRSRSGKDMPVAAYAWYVTYTVGNRGVVYQKQGNVTLLR